jgi:hypothetical protein
VRVEVPVRPGEGQPVWAQHQPFSGLDLDRTYSGAPEITLSLGGLDASMPQVSHRITRPAEIWLEEADDGRPIGLSIDAGEDGKTLVLFEKEAALPAS